MSAPSSPRPEAIDLPSPPSLDPASSSSSAEPSNTLALLLPHPFLFHPPILALLRTHYESFGPIHTWAPIRAFGRVIVVYEEEEYAMRAKKEGDHLEIGGDEESLPVQRADETSGKEDGAYFPKPIEGADGVGRHPKLTLRLYLAAPTPLLLAKDHLSPPPITKNFLISPPGSPPEGWEPILEDPPNSNTLATDLMRALEALVVKGATPMRKGERTTIIGDELEGPSVTVQDMDPEEEDDREIPDEIFESAEGHRQAVRISHVKATVDSMGGGDRTPGGSLFGGYADAFAVGGGPGKIVPTPMPPR